MAKHRDRWQELCDRVAASDDLPARPAGSWTEDKLWYWNRYIEITTTAMVGSPKWPSGLAYVDLFGGPGICEIRDSHKRIPGSSLLAAFAPKPFNKIVVCEKDEATALACRERLHRAGCESTSTVLIGDCNELIDDVVANIPVGALTLAFVDPEGLHIHFETLRKLTADRRADLLVLFADRMDLHRNVELYASQQESNLDKFLGPHANWREQWSQLANQDATHVCDLFAKIYHQQLDQQLGYIAFEGKVMRSARSPLYRVIYASKHSRGRDFWLKITRTDRGGQATMF